MILDERLPDALRPLFDAGAAERLGWTLLHSLWQGIAVAALLAVLLLALRKRSAAARHAASLAALLSLAALPVVTYVLLPAPPRPPAFVAAAPVVLTPERVPVPQTVAPDMAAPLQPAAMNPPPPPNPALRDRLAPWLPVLVATWLLGVALLSLWHLGGWLRVRRLRRAGTRPLDADWQRRFEELRRALRVSRPVKLLESSLVQVPTVAGWLRPVILVPASALSGLPPHELEAILAHELAHVRRHDYLVCIAQAAIETLMFYHPAAWWVSAQVRREREDCCDDEAAAAVGGPVPYARALASLDELRPGAAAPHLALAATGSPLLRRVRRLLGRSPTPSTRTSRRAGSLAAAVLAVTLACLPAAVTRLSAEAGAAPDPASAAVTPADRPAEPASAGGSAARPAPAADAASVSAPSVFTLKGAVTDARTGKPIEAFRVVRVPVADASGRPVKGWQNHTLTFHSAGAFEIPLEEAWPHTRLRVEAKGYAPGVSGVIEQKAGVVTVDMALNPASDTRGFVLSPDGKPVAGARVTWATITNEVYVSRGQVHPTDPARRIGAFATTGDDGSFTLPPEVDPGTIVAAHFLGYADLPSKDFKDRAKLTLRPWGVVRGTMMIPRTPQDSWQAFASTTRGDGDSPCVSQQVVVMVGADGTFELTEVIPGRAQIGVSAAASNGGYCTVPATFADITVPAGDTLTVVLGGKGRPVTGRVVSPGEAAAAVDWTKMKLRLVLEAPHVGLPQDEATWRSHQAFLGGPRRDLYTRDFTPAADGTFRLENVPQGRYQLTGPVRFAGRVVVEPMPGGTSDEPLHLGDLHLAGETPVTQKAGGAIEAGAEAGGATALTPKDIARLDPAMESKIDRREILRAEIARLRLTLLPEHRSIVMLKKDLSAVEAEIESSAKEFRAKWGPDISFLVINPEAIARIDATMAAKILDRDRIRKELADAGRRLGPKHPEVQMLKSRLTLSEDIVEEHATRFRAQYKANEANQPGVYYIGGGIPRPGVYELNGRRVNLLQALVAAGFDPTRDAGHEVVLLRRVENGQQEAKSSMKVKDLMEHRDRDISLQGDDLVLVKPPEEKPRGANSN